MTSELDHYRPATDVVAGTGIHGLAARYRELGRLRMGERVDTGRQRNGKPVMRPAKLETWRMTSTDWRLIMRAAELYGGEPSRWEEAPGWNQEKQTGVRQYQVTTDANDVPVILPPEIALTQAMEAWTAGQCLRRCDGQYDTISGAECLCRDETLDGGTQACKPTTRLSVLLTEMPGLGVWRLETHGWYAASELVPMVRMAATFGSGQGFRLRIDPRQRQTKGEDGKLVTYHFGVPVLDTDLTPGQLLAATAAPAIQAARAIERDLQQQSGAGGDTPAGQAGSDRPAPDPTSDPGPVPPGPGSDPTSPPPSKGKAGGGDDTSGADGPPTGTPEAEAQPGQLRPGAGSRTAPDHTSAAATEPAAADPSPTSEDGDAIPQAPDDGWGPDDRGGRPGADDPAAWREGAATSGLAPPIDPSPVLAWCELHGRDIRQARIYLRKTYGSWFQDLKDRKDLEELRGERADRALTYLDAWVTTEQEAE